MSSQWQVVGGGNARNRKNKKPAAASRPTMEVTTSSSFEMGFDDPQLRKRATVEEDDDVLEGMAADAKAAAVPDTEDGEEDAVVPVKKAKVKRPVIGDVVIDGPQLNNAIGGVAQQYPGVQSAQGKEIAGYLERELEGTERVLNLGSFDATALEKLTELPKSEITPAAVHVLEAWFSKKFDAATLGELLTFGVTQMVQIETRKSTGTPTEVTGNGLLLVMQIAARTAWTGVLPALSIVRNTQQNKLLSAPSQPVFIYVIAQIATIAPVDALKAWGLYLLPLLINGNAQTANKYIRHYILSLAETIVSTCRDSEIHVSKQSNAEGLSGEMIIDLMALAANPNTNPALARRLQAVCVPLVEMSIFCHKSNVRKLMPSLLTIAATEDHQLRILLTSLLLRALTLDPEGCTKAWRGNYFAYLPTTCNVLIDINKQWNRFRLTAPREQLNELLNGFIELNDKALTGQLNGMQNSQLEKTGLGRQEIEVAQANARAIQTRLGGRSVFVTVFIFLSLLAFAGAAYIVYASRK